VPDEKELIAYLEHLNNKLFKSSENDKINLTCANRLFLDAKFPVRDSYRNMSKRVFNITEQMVDFADGENALELINGWVDNVTHHKIRELFKQLDPKTVLVLANAIYRVTRNSV